MVLLFLTRIKDSSVLVKESEVLQASSVLKSEKQICQASVRTAAKQSIISGAQNFHQLSNQRSSYWVHKDKDVSVEDFNRLWIIFRLFV